MSVRKDIVVYVAGPITKGDIHKNIRLAFDAGLQLLKAGLSPHVPHGSCFWGCNGVASGDYSRLGYAPEVLPRGIVAEDWYGMDMPFVRRSDCVLRLPGDSVGSDMEAAEAEKHGIPVFHSVEEVLAWAVGIVETTPRPEPKLIPARITRTYVAPVHTLPED